jgi:hypothetical protein
MVSTELPGELGMMHLMGLSGYLLCALEGDSDAPAASAINQSRRDKTANFAGKAPLQVSKELIVAPMLVWALGLPHPSGLRSRACPTF